MRIFRYIFLFFIFITLAGCQSKIETGSSSDVQKKFKIAVVYYAPEPAVETLMRGLVDGLKNLGFEQNKNIEIMFKHCNADISNLPLILLEFDSRNYDLIIPLSTPCLVSAIKTVKKTPIVFSYVSDPLAAGTGKSFTDHLPNLTGVGSFDPVKESIDLICSILPKTKIIGTIYNSSEINSQKVVEAARKYCIEKNIKLEEITVNSSSEVYQAAQAMVLRKIDAFYGFSDNTLTIGLDSVIKVTEKNKIPIISNVAEYIDSGTVATVGFGWYKVGIKTSEKISEVLNGKNISEIPIENFIESDISINRDQAKKLNIQLPEKL